MVSVGLKALPLRKHKPLNLSQDSFVSGEDKSSCSKVGKNRKMGRKGSKKNVGFHGSVSTENQSGGLPGAAAAGKARKFTDTSTGSVPQASFVRKQVDPEMAKYFSEIANVIEGTEVDLEERSVIFGNALEEARGKEVELATDYIISHTMQTLLEGCSVDHLCDFLGNCAKDFSYISMDRSGSHVVETALRSLARHLEDDENHQLIDETMSTLCQAIAVNPVDIMCNCYGSHVLRALLRLCKGVSIDSPELNNIKPSIVLAERLNLLSSHMDNHESHKNHPFPDLLRFLISEMINPLRVDIAIIQVNQYSSLVLQTALKLLAGEEQELLHLIPILLGCHTDKISEGNSIDVTTRKSILLLVEENAYSHLMEVILEVVPDTLYGEIFTKIFKNSLFKLSSHPSGNFVVQALVSHARNKDDIKMICEELDSKFKDLLELGRAGVVAALVAASQRLQINEHKCCQALADAVRLKNESSECIVPRLLYLDNYLWSDDKAHWKWPNGVKMHVLGSLILQSILRFPSEFIQPFITSITALEDNQVFEASKNPIGARVIEAFLVSNASAKQKHKLVTRLKGHFGELSMLPSGSFTVEKCFSASKMSLRETIVSELLPFQTELSKTKQGPYLLKKVDVDGFARRPDQWRSRQTSKQSAYKEFYATFGSKDAKSRSVTFLADSQPKSQAEGLKDMRKEIDACLSSRFSVSSGAPFLAHSGSTKRKKAGKEHVSEGRRVFPESKNKRQKMMETSSTVKNIDAGKLLGEKRKKQTLKDGLSNSVGRK